MATVKLLSSTEAAKLLGITRAGFNKRVAKGSIVPHAITGPKQIAGFDRAEIEALKER